MNLFIVSRIKVAHNCWFRVSLVQYTTKRICLIQIYVPFSFSTVQLKILRILIPVWYRLRAAYSSKVSVSKTSDVGGKAKDADGAKLENEVILLDPIDLEQKIKLSKLITIETEVCILERYYVILLIMFLHLTNICAERYFGAIGSPRGTY